MNVPNEKIYLFNTVGVEYTEKEEFEKAKEIYIPFKNGKIHKEDFNHIKDNDIGFIEVSSYLGA